MQGLSQNTTQSKSFYQKSKQIIQNVSSGTKQLAHNAKPIVNLIYSKSKQISIIAYNKTKQYTKYSYEKGKQVTVNTINKTKQVSSKLYDKVKQHSSGIHQGSKIVAENTIQQTYKLIANPQTFIKLTQIIVQQQPKNQMKNNMINQLYESIFFSGLTALGLSLKNVGILQGLWKSKLIVLYTKTLIANLKLLTAKSVLLTYAPYIVPTVALSYGGYKLYMNVLNKSKKENKNVDEEDKKEQVEGEEQQLVKFSQKITKIQNNYTSQVNVEQLQDYLKSFQNVDKTQQKIF